MSKKNVSAPATQNNGQGKTKKPNPFLAIDRAILPKPDDPKEAAERALAALVAGKLSRTRRNKETGKREPVEKTLRPGKTIQMIVTAIKGGITPDEIAKAAPDLATRFPWSAGKEAIVSVAKEKLLQPESLLKLLGLVEQAAPKATASTKRVSR